MGMDALILLATPLIALALRLEDAQEVLGMGEGLVRYTLVMLVLKLAVFYRLGLYNEYWALASLHELMTLVQSTAVAAVVEVIAFYALLRPFGILPVEFPRSIPIVNALLTLVAISGLRLGIRLLFATLRRRERSKNERAVLIVGAGVAGAMTVKELLANQQTGMIPVAFMDDDQRKIGKRIHGVKVHGPLSRLGEFVKAWRIHEVVIAMPTAPGRVVREVVQACQRAGVRSKTIPGLFEILRGTARVAQLRDIQLEDLLRRGTISTDTRRVASLIHGARVLVTGAGGSIGSELCRQIRDFGPAEMLLLGHGENSIFGIAAELSEHARAGLIIRPIIADIRDRERLEDVFRIYKPEVIFHAAAHKHVNLMETNVADAVTNNVLGTRTLVDLAARYNIRRFVMISSDKAVYPTSVMGVTKRIAELVVQDAARRTGKSFVTVRFGNVLGSRGSVVPTFKRQIEHGGPVTVTHPEVRRYFMTIPEAVQLVLHAAALGEGGEVFVLDMGEQLRLVDMARDLIHLSGYEVGRDIEIVFTGLRPGEKMYEELFYADDKVEKTVHEKIFVSRDTGLHSSQFFEQDPGTLDRPLHESPLWLETNTLIEAAAQGSVHVVTRLLRALVPQYNPMPGTEPGAPQAGTGAVPAEVPKVSASAPLH
jgi:FlaA1/EpsC-like NDP-sugar epimerase